MFDVARMNGLWTTEGSVLVAICMCVMDETMYGRHDCSFVRSQTFHPHKCDCHVEMPLSKTGVLWHCEAFRGNMGI